MLVDLERRGADPRKTLSDSELLAASRRAAPQVARPQGSGDGLGLAAGFVGALAIGALTFFSLSTHREAPPPAPPAIEVPTAPVEAEAFGAPSEPVSPIPEPQVAPEAVEALPQESRALPMVIDNSAGLMTPAAMAAASGEAATETGDQGGAALAVNASPAPNATVRAEPAADPSNTIVQGATIPAVLETALNSDLPGVTRAIVSRDVRSFDGSNVLIPRGSRLIGQYRPPSSPGQTRALVTWSRLIRPDGVSIQLASPALDENGAVGLPGRVDRHFLQRFGSSLLLTVVGALPALAEGASNMVIIGRNSGGDGAAAQALQPDARIAPTIRVPIGTPIQVITTQDLSF